PACALSIAPLLDFVDFRLHKILHQASMTKTFCFIATPLGNFIFILHRSCFDRFGLFSGCIVYPIFHRWLPLLSKI
ncbi:hypothetical protein, partial [Flintibacter muris]|uniref:hypothetical protein n=1 Tax=Flintibacter muris TaxID=2941327 RepID=UPI00203D96B2